jgi:hypothetical protein
VRENLGDTVVDGSLKDTMLKLVCVWTGFYSIRIHIGGGSGGGGGGGDGGVGGIVGT